MINMQGLRRLQANLCFFSKCSKRLFFEAKTSSEKKPFDSVLYKKHNNNVLEIILNEPKKLNSLDFKMIKSMLRRVKRWVPERETASTDEDATDSENRSDLKLKQAEIPKVVIMSGAGGKSFCAGGDIASLYHSKKNGEDDKVIKDFFRYEYLLDYLLTRMRPIQVAMWNGYVMGGGVGISIHAPIRIATDNTMFAMPETAIGFFPDVGGTYFLPRVFNNDASIGLYMGLIGEKLKGKDLAKCGLATNFVAADKLEKLKLAIIEQADEDITLEKVQEIVNEFSEIVYSPDDFSFPKGDEISRTFVPDDLTEIHTRLQRLVENGSEGEQAWATNTLKTLNSFSPLSLVVTFEQIKKGMKIKTLEEAYNIEAQMVSAFVEDSDFFEGVRSKLIEKDNKPKWKHNSYKEVDLTDVRKRFFDRSEEIDVKVEENVEGEKDNVEENK